MRFRYYLDPATGEPHIDSYNVTENEVEAVLERPLEDRAAGEGPCSFLASSQQPAACFLRVIYVPDPEPESVFVVTAYDLGPKALKALRRRRKKQ